MGLSYWEKAAFFNDIDVVIIGSGIVGLNAALHLKKKHKTLKIIVLERGMLPTGASSKNAGFACIGSATEILNDLKNTSEDKVFSLIQKRWKGLQRLRKNLGDKAIDFKNYGGYEVFDSKKAYTESYEKIGYLNKHIVSIIGKKNVFKNVDKKIDPLGLKQVKHLLFNAGEGQIDTGKMMQALIAQVRNLGVEIINGFEVKELNDDGKKVSIHSTNEIHITCKRTIIATNGFAKQLLPDYPVKPARAQVLITDPIKNLKLKGTFHYDGGYYYFRNIGDRVLLGGGRNLDFKTEETSEFGLTDKIQNKLDDLLKTMILPYTKYTIDMRWSGIMGLGPEKKSIIKAVSKNVFCAVRLGGMGVAIGSLVGEEAAELVKKSL
ncbi:MAG: NAD(P)/FAD-dependent oxidoreductase [Bacteroidota bacterium]